MLRNGSPVPNFNLKDQNGGHISSDDCVGRITVFLFHRGEFCPTTDRFLTSYQDIYKRLVELDVVLVAISADAGSRQEKLADRLRVSFPMVADIDVSVAKTFHVYEGDGQRLFVEPALFIVDTDGKICYSVISSGPKGLPDPGAILPVLLYMKSHGGRY